MTKTVGEILKQFNLEIPLNDSMLKVEIYGDVEYTKYHTEHHNNIGTGEDELVYVIEGIRNYDEGYGNIELLINPKTYKRGKTTKEMVDYNADNHIATYFNEKGHGISLKYYTKKI